MSGLQNTLIGGESQTLSRPQRVFDPFIGKLRWFGNPPRLQQFCEKELPPGVMRTISPYGEWRDIPVELGDDKSAG